METIRFNYYYDGTPISKKQFEANVPENWKDELDKFREFSFGYYRAVQL